MIIVAIKPIIIINIVLTVVVVITIVYKHKLNNNFDKSIAMLAHTFPDFLVPGNGRVLIIIFYHR